MHENHFRNICSCGAIISQCRCTGPKQESVIHNGCEHCKSNVEGKSIPMQIADLIQEDLPQHIPVSGVGGVNQGTLPYFGTEQQIDIDRNVVDAVANQTTTTMRTCTATGCVHNIEGNRCRLSDIDIDARGGCAQFEPESFEGEQPSRYEEQEVDPGDMPALPAGPAQHNPGELRTWVTKRWDPRGTAV